MMTNGTDRKLTIGKDTMAISVRSRDLFPMTSTDYFESDIHSPTDSSEDSVEVKICPISVRNKRKCAEPRKVQDSFSGPMKKRMCLKVKAETGSEVHPFRPWSPKPAPASFVIPSTPSPTPTCQTKPVGSYFRPPSPIKAYDCEQPVALVKKRESIPQPCDMKANPSMLTVPALRVPVHPQIAAMSSAETDRMILSSSDVFPMLSGSASRREQRNYKNMTRERRIEANARERTRVHTISAAFDTLRRSVPAYSHNQKLSKLSVLRIACSYIMTLSSIVDEDSDGPSTAECAEMVSRTIQREGKLRKKKDDND